MTTPTTAAQVSDLLPEFIYIQIVENRIGTGMMINRWQELPFDGGTRYTRAQAPQPAGDEKQGVLNEINNAIGYAVSHEYTDDHEVGISFGTLKFLKAALSTPQPPTGDARQRALEAWNNYCRSLDPGWLEGDGVEETIRSALQSPVPQPAPVGAEEWFYEINRGPEGEENYSNVYRKDRRLVAVMKTHDAMDVCVGLRTLSKLRAATKPAVPQDQAKADAERRVINAAIGVVLADTYCHPMLSREEAVKAGVAELHDAVSNYTQHPPAMTHILNGGEEQDNA